MENGLDQLSLAENDFEIWIKYRKGLMDYKLMIEKPRTTKTEVIILIGPTGTGKSHWARNYNPDQYWKTKSQWWDGYTGQELCILDEFYGWMKFDELLRLCDQYPLQVEVKGSFVQFTSKTIIITSNKDPSKWYTNIYFEAFERRVEKWIWKGDKNTEIEFNTLTEMLYLL